MMMISSSLFKVFQFIRNLTVRDFLMQMISLCWLLLTISSLARTALCATVGGETLQQAPVAGQSSLKLHSRIPGHSSARFHAKSKPPVKWKIPEEDPEHDECPDVMTHPLEYPSIAQFTTTATKANTSIALCTLITQCSVDRFDNLFQQARAWNGPVSAAIYIHTTSDAKIHTQTSAVADLIEKLNKDDTFQGSLTVSLLFGHENATSRWKCNNPEAIGAPLYPINALRNLATAAAFTPPVTANATSEGAHPRTPPLMFLLDADFIPSPGLLQWASRPTVVDRCDSGEVIVVPAFEAKGMNHTTVPTLQYVLGGAHSRSVFQFHKDRFPPGHTPTNYTRWAQLSKPLVGEDASSVSTYPVRHRTDYEPYVILSTKRFIAYDERLRGYGQNKVVQLKWLYVFGATFHALPGHFVVAASHERPPQAHQSMAAHSVTKNSMMRASIATGKEMEKNKLPLVSITNAVLLAAAGLEHSFQRNVNVTAA